MFTINVVKKAKWDAWNKLGQMQGEEAMVEYVDNLKSVINVFMESFIIEAMPQTDDVAEFMQTIGCFYELVEFDENSPIGEVLARIGGESQANGDNSAEAGFDHSGYVTDALCIADPAGGDGGVVAVKGFDHNENLGVEVEVLTENLRAAYHQFAGRMMKHMNSETESESEEFCDTSDDPIMVTSMVDTEQQSSSTPLNKVGNHVHFSNTNVVHTNVDVHTGRVSPIEADTDLPTYNGLGLTAQPTTFPLAQERNLSESLYVNAASQDSMNLSGGSSNTSRRTTDADFSSESVRSTDLNRSDQGHVRGGGQQEQTTQRGMSTMQLGETSTGATRKGLNSGSGGGSRRGLFSGSGGGGRRGDMHQQDAGDINEQIAVAMVRLQQDMSGVMTRLNSLESISRSKVKEEVRRRTSRCRKWWPFPEVSMGTAAFIVLWPFLAHYILKLVFRGKRRH